jgi:hypothetical protein
MECGAVVVVVTSLYCFATLLFCGNKKVKGREGVLEGEGRKTTQALHSKQSTPKSPTMRGLAKNVRARKKKVSKEIKAKPISRNAPLFSFLLFVFAPVRRLYTSRFAALRFNIHPLLRSALHIWSDWLYYTHTHMIKASKSSFRFGRIPHLLLYRKTTTRPFMQWPRPPPRHHPHRAGTPPRPHSTSSTAVAASPPPPAAPPAAAADTALPPPPPPSHSPRDPLAPANPRSTSWAAATSAAAAKRTRPWRPLSPAGWGRTS